MPPIILLCPTHPDTSYRYDMILGMGFRTSLSPCLLFSLLTLCSPQHLHPPRFRQLRLIHYVRPRLALRPTPLRHNRLRRPLRLRQSASQRRRHDLRPVQEPRPRIPGSLVSRKLRGEKSSLGSEDSESVAVHPPWRTHSADPCACFMYLEVLL